MGVQFAAVDQLIALPRQAQFVLGGSLLYLLCSFLNWQQVSLLGVTAGASEWHGIGVLAGLLAVLVVLWEAARLFAVKIDLGSAEPGLISLALALLLALFTFITFLSHDQFRNWPEWLGLLLALVIAGAAIARARGEGVKLPGTGP